MKRIGSLFLTSGLLLMLVTLASATMTMRSASTGGELVATPNACLNCHQDAHIEWQFSGDIDTLFEDDAEAFCISCHTTDDDLLDTLEDVESRVDALQQRTDTLHAELDRVYAHYPDWDADTDYLLKSTDQRTAERIATLVEYVEADGSWGLHDADYTDRLLSEAEFLMAQLLDALVEED